MTILDLGCGSGWLTKRVAKRFGLSICVDINPYNEWYSDKDPSLEFVVGDARILPIRSDAVEAVIAISLLEHVPRWGKVIEEAFRVLKRGSLLIVQIPNLMYPIEPHTRFPLVGFLPGKLRLVLVSTMGYRELQFSCTLRNVIEELRKQSFEYWLYFFYHTSRKLPPLPPSFFIIALKKAQARAGRSGKIRVEDVDGKRTAGTFHKLSDMGSVEAVTLDEIID